MTSFNIIRGAIHPDAVNWVNRIQRNGGGTPSYYTVQAASEFCEGIYNVGLSSSMKTVNIYAPDSLIACQTPLMLVSGTVDPWINSNFVASDLTIQGLAGNGSTKRLNTGLTASVAWPSPNTGSAGMTMYVTTGNSGTENDMGVWATGTTNDLFSAYISYSGTAYWDCWNAGTGRVSAGNASWTGFISFNRTAINATRIDRAKSTIAYSTLVSGVTSTGNKPPANTIMVHSQWGSGYSTKRFSFAAVHMGLDFKQGNDLYDLVQKTRQRMGGGWV